MPGLTLRWHGALSYGTQDGRVSSSSMVLDRPRIAQLEPHLRQPPQQAVYEPEQGALDAVAATHALPAISLRYQAPPGLVRAIISSHAMEVRQAEDGTMLVAEDYVDDAPDNQPAAIALRTASAIKGELEGAEAIAPEFACIGLRPMPFDGVPVIGNLPQVGGAYVCAMHPGVVLAAIVGQLASGEIVTGEPASALEACRPARFLAC